MLFGSPEWSPHNLNHTLFLLASFRTYTHPAHKDTIKINYLGSQITAEAAAAVLTHCKSKPFLIVELAAFFVFC